MLDGPNYKAAEPESTEVAAENCEEVRNGPERMPEPVKEVPEPEQVLKSLYQVGRVQSDSFAWTEPGCGVGKTGLRDGPGKTPDQEDWSSESRTLGSSVEPKRWKTLRSRCENARS